jgi:hypothetical protein
MDTENDRARIGGWPDDEEVPREVEMDEVLLRVRAEMVDGKAKVRTLRYVGITERGDSRSVLLFELPDKIVEAGGGGPISSAELHEILKVPGEEDAFRILPHTIIHTDSARAYCNLGCREPWRATPAEERGRNPDESEPVRAARLSLENQDCAYLQSGVWSNFVGEAIVDFVLCCETSCLARASIQVRFSNKGCPNTGLHVQRSIYLRPTCRTTLPLWLWLKGHNLSKQIPKA